MRHYQHKIESLQSKQDSESSAHAKEMESMKTKVMKIIKEKGNLEFVKARLDSADDKHLVEREDKLNKLEIKANSVTKGRLQDNLNEVNQVKGTLEKELQILKEKFANASEEAVSVQTSMQDTVNKLDQKEEQFNTCLLNWRS